MDDKEVRENIKADFKRKRSRILYQITVMIIVVLVAAGLASFFFFCGSQNRLVEKSVDKLIESEAGDFSSTYGVVTDFVATEYEQRFADPEVVEGFVTAVMNEELTQEQEELSQLYQQMIDEGLIGTTLMISLLPPGEIFTDTIVIASSDESLIYEWQVPAYVLKALEEEEPYIYMEDGIPELGFEGEQLILLKKYEGAQDLLWFMAVRPMAEDVREINEFFDEEKSKTNLVLVLVIAGSVILIIIITFFVLSYLIRKQITEPIDELSAAAEQVMEGDLDVDVNVREGEEFEGLKRVFKEMIDSIKLMIERSTKEG